MYVCMYVGLAQCYRACPIHISFSYADWRLVDYYGGECRMVALRQQETWSQYGQVNLLDAIEEADS